MTGYIVALVLTPMNQRQCFSPEPFHLSNICIQMKAATKLAIHRDQPFMTLDEKRKELNVKEKKITELSKELNDKDKEKRVFSKELDEKRRESKDKDKKISMLIKEIDEKIKRRQ